MRSDVKPMIVCKPIIFNTLAFSRATAAYRYDEDGLLDLVAIDVLREGYDPTTLEAIGPIIETESENVLTYSNEFSNAAWTKNIDASITSEASEVTPSGSTGCEAYNESSPAGSLTHPSPFSIGESAVFSIYAKYVDSNISMYGIGGDSAGYSFDLVAGTVSDPTKARIQELPDGWFRCSIFGVTSSSLVGIYIPVVSTGKVLIYGAQLEAGLVASSLIDTTSIPMTRAADLYGDPPTMISSNILEDDYPDYNPATTYDAGDMVMVRGTTHRNYQSVAGSNTGNFPPDFIGGLTPKWIDAGATMRWRMFDSTVGSDLQSENDFPIYVTVAVDTQVSSITLLNVEGVEVIVNMRNSDNEIIDSRTIDILGDPAEATWWDYLFGRRKIIKNITLTDFPENENTTIQVIVNGEEGDDPTKLGKLIIGEGIVLGYTEYGSSIGIIDYSTKEADTFGNYSIQERQFVGKADLRIIVEPGYESFVRDTLADLRATPSVYIGHQDYEATIIYGFYKDFSILFSTPADSFCSMTVEGI